jgi:2-polyprenyl-6-methoxyphenol hydroxylase-like FAD-dependent oxidoreductase
MGRSRFDHVVILGGSIGGLLAARAGCGHARRVTVLERDPLRDDGAGRKGTPQAHHAHGLLVSGHRSIEELFPGFSDAARARGVTFADVGTRGVVFVGGGPLAPFTSDLRGPVMSRGLLERILRERSRSRPDLELRTGVDVQGLVTADHRVTGVRLTDLSTGEAEVISADLIVDAMGRGSRGRAFVELITGEHVYEEKVLANIRYVTRRFRPAPESPPAPAFAVNAVEHPARRGGVLVREEDGLLTATIIGYLGEHPPEDVPAFREFARSLPLRSIGEVIADAEPVGEVHRHYISGSVRRRYASLRRPLVGYLPFGDAIASVNPAHGQGMSIVALQALALRRCLDHGVEDLWSSFLAEADRVVDRAWAISAGADLAFPEVEGKRSPATQLIGRYLGRVFRAAHRDPVVAHATTRVMHLLDPPPALMRPSILLRVLAHGR